MLKDSDLISFPVDPDELLDTPIPTSINKYGLISYHISDEDSLEYEITREMVAGLIARLINRQHSLIDQKNPTLQPAIASLDQAIQRLIQIRDKISTTDPQGMIKVQDACRPLSKALYEANIATFDEKEVF
jgi:hypothetical protein